MCDCPRCEDVTEPGMVSAAHVLQEIRDRREAERRTVRLADSLIAEAEWLTRTI